MNKNFVSRQQLFLLPKRVLKAEQTYASQELYGFLWDKFKKNYAPLHIMIVGAGGSYPASLIAEHSIRDKMCTSNIEVTTPQTAIRKLKQLSKVSNNSDFQEYDIVIGVSYSGKTPDIIAVSEVCNSKGYPFILLTGADKSELKEYENELFKIVSYFNAEYTSGKDRGMISMFSTLMPAIIFDDYVASSTHSSKHYFDIYQNNLKNGESFVSELNIADIANSINKIPVIHIFYEWASLPTATDIESKFIESGIANVILHEKKNFSHGRFTALFKQDFALVINLTCHSEKLSNDKSKVNTMHKCEYDKLLSNFLKELCKSKSAHYIEMGNELIDSD